MPLTSPDTLPRYPIRQNNIAHFIRMARAKGARVRITIDAEARRDEGRLIIETVQVSGLKGCGPHPMGVLSAVERLSAALAEAA